jgi:hypothetical protein
MIIVEVFARGGAPRGSHPSGSGFDAMTILVVSLQHPFAATSGSRRRAGFTPVPARRRLDITRKSSTGPSSTAAAARLQSSATFGCQRSFENHSPPKPLPRQIPVDGQALTAFPCVRSSRVSDAGPKPGRSVARGRHRKPFPAGIPTVGSWHIPTNWFRVSIVCEWMDG